TSQLTACGPEAMGKRSCVAGVGAVLAVPPPGDAFWQAAATSTRRHTADARPATAIAILALTIVWPMSFLAAQLGTGWRLVCPEIGETSRCHVCDCSEDR